MFKKKKFAKGFKEIVGDHYQEFVKAFMPEGPNPEKGPKRALLFIAVEENEGGDKDKPNNLAVGYDGNIKVLTAGIKHALKNTPHLAKVIDDAQIDLMCEKAFDNFINTSNK